MYTLHRKIIIIVVVAIIIIIIIIIYVYHILLSYISCIKVAAVYAANNVYYDEN